MLRALASSSTLSASDLLVSRTRNHILFVHNALRSGGRSVDDPHDQPHPVAAAARWTSRIFTVVLMMLLPAWLGHRTGSEALTLLGVLLGLVVGMWYLLRSTGAIHNQPSRDSDQDEDED